MRISGFSVFDAAFFAYSWKLPAHSGALLLTIDNLSFLAYTWSFFAYSFSFLLTVGAFCLQWESVSNKGLTGL